jgi:hypothetical protein
MSRQHSQRPANLHPRDADLDHFVAALRSEALADSRCIAAILGRVIRTSGIGLAVRLTAPAGKSNIGGLQRQMQCDPFDRISLRDRACLPGLRGYCNRLRRSLAEVRNVN